MKFTIDHPDYAGRTFEVLFDDDVTWREADQIERVTGTTIDQIATDRDVWGKAQVKLAFFWTSVKREMPEVTYSDMLGLPLGKIRLERDEPDPTPAGEDTGPSDPAIGSSEPSTSEPSPDGSASDPGNGST